uniref:Nucleotide-diphospho-sugar transferase domain-containing protein n=1 Tax=Panagrolaimus superbus TaxID=310955 RepID=A0A914YTV1_9BILA
MLSSSLKPRYLFLLPFTVASWKKLGVKSVVVLTDDEKEFELNGQAKKTIKLLKELNAHIIYLTPEKLSHTSLSQLIRVFGPVLPIPFNSPENETVIITSDADLVVFNISNHLPNITDGKTLHLYNSRCCHPVRVPPARGAYKVHMYPMGTIGATIKTWKDIMGFNDTQMSLKEIEEYILGEFGENIFHPNDDGNRRLVGSFIWYADQSLMSYKLNEWFKNTSNRNFLSEHTKAPIRIDRIKWPTAENFTKMKIEEWDDCHQPVAAFMDKEWEKFKPFLDFAFSYDKNMIERFVKYRNDFVLAK